LEDIVDSSIDLSYRHAKLHRLAKRYNKPYAKVDYIS